PCSDAMRRAMRSRCSAAGESSKWTSSCFSDVPMAVFLRWRYPNDTTARAAQVGAGGPPQALLDVLDLLAHLLDEHLHVDGNAGELERRRFGAQRVRFAVQLLDQEIEPLADLAAFPDQP